MHSLIAYLLSLRSFGNFAEIPEKMRSSNFEKLLEIEMEVVYWFLTESLSE